MNLLRRIIYVSQVTRHFTKVAEQNLVQGAQRSNRKNDVTGFLACSGMHFLQLLEGRPDCIESLLQKLPGDERHANIRMLDDRPIDSRRYARWSMAYVYSLDIADELLRWWECESVDLDAIDALLRRIGPDPGSDLL